MTDKRWAHVTEFVDTFERWIADGSAAKAMRELHDECARLRARASANEAVRAAARYVVACDDEGFGGALSNAIDRLRVVLASDQTPEGKPT